MGDAYSGGAVQSQLQGQIECIAPGVSAMVVIKRGRKRSRHTLLYHWPPRGTFLLPFHLPHRQSSSQWRFLRCPIKRIMPMIGMMFQVGLKELDVKKRAPIPAEESSERMVNRMKAALERMPKQCKRAIAVKSKTGRLEIELLKGFRGP